MTHEEVAALLGRAIDGSLPVLCVSSWHVADLYAQGEWRGMIGTAADAVIVILDVDDDRKIRLWSVCDRRGMTFHDEWSHDPMQMIGREGQIGLLRRFQAAKPHPLIVACDARDLTSPKGCAGTNSLLTV